RLSRPDRAAATGVSAMSAPRAAHDMAADTRQARPCPAPSPLPTPDLYFLHACADLAATGAVARLAPTVLRVGGTLIVFRHAAGLARLPRHDRLIFVADDDWRAGLRDPALPWSYRAKLLAVDCRLGRRAEAAADMIVAASPALAARYRRLC